MFNFRHLITAVLLFTSMIISAQAGTRQLAFRWGEIEDEQDLIDHAIAIGPKYRLTEKNIRSIIQFQIAKNWAKSSGDGVFFSNYPSEWYGDGRYDLYVIELVTPDENKFPISQGALGTKVRDFYLNGGPSVPMVNQYGDTAFFAARVPTDAEYASGLQINFWPATAADAADAWKQLSANELATPEARLRAFQKFADRLSNSDYGPKATAKTLSFISALAELAEKTETSKDVLTQISLVKALTEKYSCRAAMIKAQVIATQWN